MSRKIFTPPAERIAPEDSPYSFERTPAKSVLPHRQNVVITARGIKSTLPPDEVAKRVLINPNEENRDVGGKVPNHAKQGHSTLLLNIRHHYTTFPFFYNDRDQLFE